MLSIGLIIVVCFLNLFRELRVVAGLLAKCCKAYYLYGAVAPQTGESFWLEFSHKNGVCFQIFLEQLASDYPDNLNVVQLDNGRFHHSSNLKIPDNILLIFNHHTVLN